MNGANITVGCLLPQVLLRVSCRVYLDLVSKEVMRF